VARAAGGRPFLTHNLKVLSGVSFLQDAASELLYPILPIFLTVTLGAPAAVVGIIEGLAEGAASLTKLFSGRIADRRAKRPLIALGYGMAAAGKLLIAVATVWPTVLAGRVVDRLGKGVRGAPRDALLMVDVAAVHRGRVFGFHRFADTLGAVVGPLIGLVAYELFGHRIRPLLVVAVVPAVASVLLVRLVFDASSPRAARAPAPQPVQAAQPLPPQFRRTVAMLVAFSLVNFPDALLLLRVSDISNSLPFVVLAYAAYNAVYALLSYPAGALSDRLGPRRIFAVGLACFVVAYIGLGLVHSRAAIWPILLIYGGFTVATDGVGKAWIAYLTSTARALPVESSSTGRLPSGAWSVTVAAELIPTPRQPVSAFGLRPSNAAGLSRPSTSTWTARTFSRTLTWARTACTVFPQRSFTHSIVRRRPSVITSRTPAMNSWWGKLPPRCSMFRASMT
jgi:MFS family permease